MARYRMTQAATVDALTSIKNNVLGYIPPSLNPKTAFEEAAFQAYLQVKPNGTKSDNEFNPFRHAYSSAKLAQYAGTDVAIIFGDGVEGANSKNYKQVNDSGYQDAFNKYKVDIYNNDMGIEIGNARVPSGGLFGYDAGLTAELWSKIQSNELATQVSEVPPTYSHDATFFDPQALQEFFSDPFKDVLDFMKELLASQYDKTNPVFVTPESDFAQAIGDFFKAAFAANTGNFPPVSPLVLDLSTGGTGVTLKNLNSTSAVYWDIDRDGFRQKIGWVTPDMGLLAIDKNGNGTIDSNTELFGNEPENNKNNGFETLAVYDTNTDGHITSTDAQFNNLRVWQDINGDGFSQINEIKSLNDLGITDINLGYTNTNYQIEGNDILQTSTFTMNGNTRTVADAWFAQGAR